MKMSKTQFRHCGKSAFTLIELLIVITVLFLLAAMIHVPGPNAKVKASRTMCMSNLRQVGVSLIAWSDDHRGAFPWEIQAESGGSSSNNTIHVFPYFQMVSNRVYSPSPRIFHCLSDPVKVFATNWSQLSDANISYFVSLTTITNPLPQTTILSGDRHLQLDGKPLKATSAAVSTSSKIEWTRELHPKSSNGSGGNLLFLDGHVEWKTNDVAEVFRTSGPNRLIVP
jgi:prepilin-type processing-associated H-X9-DG protein